VDGTITTDGRLRSSTLGALERLGQAGVPVVLVTGRPAGFAEAWARTLPVAGFEELARAVLRARGARR
jgi:hydroxymethylpyrimidine pyrophosphatase-like HAD family hydrolase